jgi:hypothetical protein
MADRGYDWRSILLGLASLAGALSAFAVGGMMVLYTILMPVHTDLAQSGPTTLQAIVVASGVLLSGAIFLPAAYYSFQRVRGAEVPEAAPGILKLWQGVLLILLWAGAALLAQLWVDQDILKWFTPPLYLLAIGTPVYSLVRLAAGGLNAGSRQRLWGIPAATIALGTTFSIFAEGLLLLVGLAGGLVYLGLHPEQVSFFRQIANQITDASSIDSVLSSVGPLIESPLIIVLALVFFSGLTPVIEETSKSIAAWTVFDHLGSPAQGFVIGALSGAGFGLVESLLASATPDPTWAATLMIRGGSTMMHILTASITGWGIASFRTHKSTFRLIGSYALAVFLHSSWNTAVILVVFGDLRITAISGPRDPLGLVMVFFGSSVLVTLCLAIPLALGFINRWFRRNSVMPLITAPAEGMGDAGQAQVGNLEGVK